MIFRLEIENFYSFRECQSLDLRVSEKVSPNSERFAPLYSGSSERAPKVVATFGANGAGKTNFLRSLAFLAWFTRDSFQLPPEAPVPLPAFNDKESHNRESRLAISFGGQTDLAASGSSETTFGIYDYEVVVRRNIRGNSVARETLRHRVHGSRRSFRVFDRSGAGEVLDGENFSLTGYRSVIDKIRPNASVISTLAQFDHGPSLTLRNAARSIFTNVLVVKQDYTDDQLLAALAANSELFNALNREIPRADLGIRSVKIVPGQLRSDVQFDHEGLDFPVPWAFESHGTQSFVRSFPLIAAALREGGVAVIDELDASLHPLMLGEIFNWFYDPSRNPHNASLWITCQAASLLEELEKEEIVFCEKDSSGRTIIYGLQDIKNVRRIDNYYRKYLSGAYGALPAFG